MQEEIIEHDDIDNKDVQLILKKSNELLLGAKKIIDEAYENKDIGTLKDIHDQAITLEGLTKRRNMGIDLGNEIAEIRIYDEKKMGELLPNIIRKPEEGRPKEVSSRSTLLKELGLNRNQSSYYQDIAKIPEIQFNEEINKLKDKKKEITTNYFVKYSKKLDRDKHRSKKIEDGKKIILKDIDFRLGDFNKVLDDIPDNSIDCIITDPPYPYKYINCWTDLSQFAGKKLKPSGFCVCYTPHIYLPEILKRMMECLDYYWICCLYQTGPTSIVRDVNMMARWKPILIYQKPPKKKLKISVQDYIVNDKREKDDHDWQQGADATNKFIEYFTSPGDIICDPFVGSGTTLYCAKKLKRNCIGAEIDENTFNLAKTRLSEVMNG